MIVITSSEHLYMGNKLLQYAVFIALAEEESVKIANPSFAPYAHHFKSTSRDFYNRYPSKKTWFVFNKKIRNVTYKFLYHFARHLAAKNTSNRFIASLDIDWERECQIDSADFITKAKKTNFFFVMGWNFKHNYSLVKHRSAIKRFFEPLDIYTRNINSLINNIKPGYDLLVGVHIRQGDYKTFEGGRYYYETTAYHAAMKLFIELNTSKKIKFLVCSNSTQLPQSFEGTDFSFGTGHPVEDMYAFSHCDYIMGPPSTYTMWASFYGNKPLHMIEKMPATFTMNDFKVKDQF